MLSSPRRRPRKPLPRTIPARVTQHNPAPCREAISLSGASKWPRLSVGGTTSLIASSFSAGSDLRGLHVLVPEPEKPFGGDSIIRSDLHSPATGSPRQGRCFRRLPSHLLSIITDSALLDPQATEDRSAIFRISSSEA